MDLKKYNESCHVQKLDLLFDYLATLPLSSDKMLEFRELISMLYIDALTDAFDEGNDHGFNEGYETCAREIRSKRRK